MYKFFCKGSRFYGIIKNLCPKCQSGRFWKESNPYKNIFDKNLGNCDSCDNCHFKYEIEPGFWYGAMYVSYGLAIVFSVLIYMLLVNINNDIEVFNQFLIISISILLISPVNYFYSRIIWINFFVKYQK